MRRGRFKSECPMMIRCCMCGNWFTSGRPHAATCSRKCRKKRSRQGYDNYPADARPADPSPAKESSKKNNAGESKRHPWDAILTKGKADSGLAMKILGVKPPLTKNAAYAAFKKLVLEHHPDRGGGVKMTQWIYAAWDYLKAFHQWK